MKTVVCYVLYSDMACSVAGITSDANVLTNELRLIAQRFVTVEWTTTHVVK